MRAYYKTAYDTTNTICGYVIPKIDRKGHIWITKQQYRRALLNRNIGGDAGLIFCDAGGNRIDVNILGIDR